MRTLSLLVVATLLVGCGGTGPIYPVDAELFDWVKTPEAIDPSSDYPPEVIDPEVKFNLLPGDRVSALQAGQDWRTGQTYLFGFDVRLDRRSLGNETVALSKVYRTGSDGETELASVSLDARRGVIVFGRTCIPASELGEWHRVEMRVRFTNNDRGFFEIFCDRKPIWGMTKIRTTFPPPCRRSEGCNAEIPKPTRYKWLIGMMSDRPVRRTVRIEMQRLHYRLLFYIPNRAGNL